jgi:hypothetical protein
MAFRIPARGHFVAFPWNLRRTGSTELDRGIRDPSWQVNPESASLRVRPLSAPTKIRLNLAAKNILK